MELRGGALPPLPAVGTPQAKSMAGPTSFSNWVIPGQVIAGAYPASMDDAETERTLSLLLGLGMNTFVCLQAEVNIHIPEHAWRSGMGLRPYIKDAQKILSKAHESNSNSIKQRKIDFLHLPIIDGSVTTDTAMSRLADDCCERVLRGEKLYIHCWGGHGRTGTLVATMLGRLYNLAYSSALRYTQAYHDTRVYPQGVRSPQTAVQRAQVRRLLLMSSSIPAAVAARTLAAVNSPPIKTTAAGLNSSNSGSGIREPVTPTKTVAAVAAAGGISPITPVRQSAGPPSSGRPGGQAAGAAAAAAQHYKNWMCTTRSAAVTAAAATAANPPGGGTAAGSMAVPTGLYAGFFNSISPSRSAPVGVSRANTTFGSSSSNAGTTAAAAARGIESAGSVLGNMVVYKQRQQRQQQRIIPGAVGAQAALLAGSMLAAPSAAAAALRGSSVLRAVGPQTPVQQHISSRNTLIKRPIEVPTA